MRIRFPEKPLRRFRILPVDPQPVGEVSVQVQLENTIDRGIAIRGGLSDVGIRSWVGPGIVDTGAVLLAIPAEVAEALGLDVLREEIVGLADGSNLPLNVAGPVELTVVNRSMTTEAIVLPAGSEVLIGQIVLERLDLLVDCQNQTLVPRPESPIFPSLKLKQAQIELEIECLACGDEANDLSSFAEARNGMMAGID